MSLPVAVLLVCTIPLSVSAAQDPWTVADSAVRRLTPHAYPDLPPALADYLTARGCTIPQSFASDMPHNVVRGAFSETGKAEWAVLCSVRRQSRILVFLGGDTVAVAELGAGPDRNFLQGLGAEGIAYSRYLTLAPPGRVREVIVANGAAVPMDRVHDGLEDLFLEKASVVHYHHNGEWFRFVGAD